MQVARIQVDSPYDNEEVHIVITEPEKQLENPKFFQEYYDFYESVHPVVEILELYYPEKKIETVQCYHCELDIVKSRARIADLYNTPFDEAPETVYFCSLLCREAQEGHVYSKDFNYFHCPGCDRYICEQNPRNGWHVQYRMLNDEQICNKCYEEYCFENGIDTEEFEAGKIQGLFFNDSELREHGYITVPGFYNSLIQSQDTVDSYIKKALGLIEAGHKVINNYERLGIGGGEGYVTMWVK